MPVRAGLSSLRMYITRVPSGISTRSPSAQRKWRSSSTVTASDQVRPASPERYSTCASYEPAVRKWAPARNSVPSPICLRLRLVVRQPVRSGPLQVRPWSRLRYSHASPSAPKPAPAASLLAQPRLPYGALSDVPLARPIRQAPSGALAGSKLQFHGRPRWAYQRSDGTGNGFGPCFQSTASSSESSRSLMIERHMK